MLGAEAEVRGMEMEKNGAVLDGKDRGDDAVLLLLLILFLLIQEERRR
jgi:hypothetical protein